MRARLAGVTKSHGAQVVLEDASLEVGPRARIGLVGPNGVGKSTVLRLLAGEEAPDRGVVGPRSSDPDRRPSAAGAGGARRRDAPRAPRASNRRRCRRARARGRGRCSRRRRTTLVFDSTQALSDRYDLALSRFMALGGADFDARAGVGLRGARAGRRARPAVHGALGRRGGAGVARRGAARPGRPAPSRRADERPRRRRARAADAFVDSSGARSCVVSHDRAFLDRDGTRIAEIDPRSHADRRVGGRLVGLRAPARRGPRRPRTPRSQTSQERRRELTTLLSAATEARRRARARRAAGGADRRGTHALRTKVRQAERLLERNPLPEKPFEPWELRLELRSTGRLPSPVVRLSGAVVERGAFRLGPLDLELHPGERLAVTGRERDREDDAAPRAARRARADRGYAASSAAASCSA